MNNNMRVKKEDIDGIIQTAFRLSQRDKNRLIESLVQSLGELSELMDETRGVYGIDTSLKGEIKLTWGQMIGNERMRKTRTAISYTNMCAPAYEYVADGDYLKRVPVVDEIKREGFFWKLLSERWKEWRKITLTTRVRILWAKITSPEYRELEAWFKSIHQITKK